MLSAFLGVLVGIILLFFIGFIIAIAANSLDIKIKDFIQYIIDTPVRKEEAKRKTIEAEIRLLELKRVAPLKQDEINQEM